MAAILDAMPELEEQVLFDLTADGVRSDFGRDGLSAQQVLRLMVLYTMLRTTFEQLEFHLADSPTYRAFCLLGLTDPPPKRASIAGNLAKLLPATLQALHVHVVRYAVEHKLETVSAVRTDTTTVAAPIRAPLDSALLSDSVRVLTRLLERAQKWIPTQMPNHRRRVTHRATSLRAPKVSKEDRAALYADLIDDTKIYVEAALFAATYLEGIDDLKAYLLSLDLARKQSVLCVLWTKQSAEFSTRKSSLLRKSWCRFLNLTLTFCASETVSCTDTKCVCRLGKRVLCSQRKYCEGILRTRR